MVITYKCPNCGGGLQFDPKEQKYKCEFCFSLFSQEELEALEEEQEVDEGTGKEEESSQSDEGTEEQSLYECPSCGAKIVTDETTVATFCYYCHNPVVFAGKLHGEFRPDEVIPFGLDRKEAERIFLEWIQKKRFIPSDFFSKKQIEKLSGIYFPYWLYDCEVEGSVQALGFRTRVWRSGDIQYTETKRYEVEREGVTKIRNVAKNALKKADHDLVEGVLPYQMEARKAFSNTYLTGFAAENRDMERAEIQSEIYTEVENFAKENLRAEAQQSYERIQIVNQNVNRKDESWKYVLLPVWLLTYQDKKRDRVYYFALNGQTGRMCGELPVDYKKLSLLFASIFVPLLILFLIGGYLL